MKAARVVVLFSGGIDSWACLNWAIHKYGRDFVIPLFADYGQQYARKELQVATLLCIKLGVQLIHARVDNFLVEDTVTGHTPLRNTLLLLYAASACPNVEGVVFGMLKGDSSEDKDPKYIKLMQKLFDSQFKKSIYRKETKPFEIMTPFANLTKRQLVQWCMRHTPMYGLYQTVGCYGTYDTPCGSCMSCFNRWVGRKLNGLPDETYAVRTPPEWMIDEFLVHPPVNGQMYTLRQIWLKRFWLWDTYQALNHHCKTLYRKSLYQIIKQRKSQWRTLKSQSS